VAARRGAERRRGERGVSAESDRLVREDAAARRLAQSEFGRPLAVEAGAGTGKTAVLVARVVGWCLGPGWELAAEEMEDSVAPREVAARALEGVVAITFTEAAAGEMAGRVAQALVEVSRGGAPIGVDLGLLPSSARERARHLAAATHRLEARTIHSFCASLLRRWPIEAGIAPDFEVDADGTLTEAAAFEAVEQAMRQALASPPDPGWTLLAAAERGPDQLQRAVATLAALEADEELADDPFTADALAALRTDALAAVDDLLALIGTRLDAVPRSSTREDVVLLRAARQVLAAAPEVPWLGAARPFGRSGEKPRERLAKWARGELTQGEVRALEGLDTGRMVAAAARVAQVARDLECLEPEGYRTAMRVLGPLVAVTRRRLVEHGVIGFDGLLRRARELLAAHPRVADEVRSGIRQLLVDEFQDTDRLQCDIVRRLGLQGERRPGLFVVGDPKQSIYGWRSADLAAYESFRQELERAGGQVVRLAVSFRSVPPILSEVERSVAPVMVRRPGLQPEFQPLVASESRQRDAPFRDAARAPVEAWLTWPGGPEGAPDSGARSVDRLEAEAKALVADLTGLHRDHGIAWGRMAVLLRSTSDLDRYLEEMRAAGIPFAVNRERAYYRQREVVAAAALMRVLLDPSDALAQLALLRSDAVLVPDAALLPLWRRGLPQLMAEAVRGGDDAAVRLDALIAGIEVPRDAPGIERMDGWRDVLRLAVRALMVLRRELRDRPPALFVERARTLWPLQVVASARYLGSFRVARLERFWDELETVLETQGDRPAAVARFLRRAVEEARESPVAPAPAQAGDAVQVMTIHGAKGLDFDHLYLVQLDKRSGGRATGRGTGLLGRGEGRAACLLGWPSPGYLEGEREQERVGACERVRLLYVAMTRARERVVLSGAWEEDLGGEDPDSARSLLDLVGHRLDADVAEALLTGSAGSLEDEHGVRWRTVGAVVAESGGPAPFEPPGNRPETVIDPDVVARARDDARRRMERPWSASVSGEAERRVEERSEEAPALDRRQAPVLVRGDAAVAAAVGTAIHEAMERLDPELAEPLSAIREEATARLASVAVDESWSEAARKSLERVLGGLARGLCLRRWRELAPKLVARELPVLLPPQGEDGPVGFVSGAVDLVALGGEGGGLVVVDYKTDAVAPGAGLEERVARYRPQLTAYARALGEALGLDAVPASEIWFLAADEVVRLDTD